MGAYPFRHLEGTTHRRSLFTQLGQNRTQTVKTESGRRLDLLSDMRTKILAAIGQPQRMKCIDWHARPRAPARIRQTQIRIAQQYLITSENEIHVISPRL